MLEGVRDNLGINVVVDNTSEYHISFEACIFSSLL